MIGVVLGLLAAGAATPLATYNNAKYGFTTCYPSRLLQPSREADAGDGRVFTAHDGAELRTYGAYALDPSDTPAREAADLTKDLGGTVKYHAQKPTWTVVSGVSGRNIFWLKVIKRDDRLLLVTFKYPAGEAGLYDPVVPALNSCSRLGTAPF